MANKLVAFRLPEEIIQAIESQAAATGSDKTAVVIQALKQVFKLPSWIHTPATSEELEERLNKVEKKMMCLSEQLAKLSQVKSLDSGALLVALKLPEKIIHKIESEATATGSNTAVAVLPTLNVAEILQSEGRIPLGGEALSERSIGLEETL